MSAGLASLFSQLLETIQDSVEENEGGPSLDLHPAVKPVAIGRLGNVETRQVWFESACANRSALNFKLLFG